MNQFLLGLQTKHHNVNKGIDQPFFEIGKNITTLTWAHDQIPRWGTKCLSHDEKEWNASKWVGQMVYLNSIKLYIVKISMFLDGDSKINNTLCWTWQTSIKAPIGGGGDDPIVWMVESLKELMSLTKWRSNVSNHIVMLI